MIALAAMLAWPAVPPSAERPAEVDCRILVAAESADEVWDLGFDGEQLAVREVVPVGYQVTEIEGPHGLTVAPDGRHWYVSLAHGKPNGLLYKYDAETHEAVGRTELGLFPATMQISEDTGLLYCVNFDLHGDMTPSTISVVDVDAMVEVERVVTGSMPHGSRLSPDGATHFSCAMMSDELIEVDAAGLEVVRRLVLTDGIGRRGEDHGDHLEGEDSEQAALDAITKPTWVQPHPTGEHVYVALNGVHQVVEVDLESWAIVRRFPTGRAPYNLDVTPDGSRLVVTYKGAQSVGVIDLETGEELARIETRRPIPHGVVLDPGGRFAFVSCEDRGGNPGSVDVIDLERLKRVASVDVGLQAGGIALFPKRGR